MRPTLNTGLFITLSLLLTRRADAGMCSMGMCLDLCPEYFSAVYCCQDNTWDIAVAENPQHPVSSRGMDIQELPSDEAGVDFPASAIISAFKKSGTFLSDPPLTIVGAPTEDFIASLFHPPTPGLI